jgi:hypothetical protein
MKAKILILVLLAMLTFTNTAYAEKPTCKSTYLVKAEDTLRKISVATGVSPYDIMRANKASMDKPNYPVFLGIKLCIPAPETKKTFPGYVLDQPAARLSAKQDGKSLIITTNSFPLGSNWVVKVDGKKTGKIKIENKGAWSKSFRVSGSSVCLKNQMTDFNYCAKVAK